MKSILNLKYLFAVALAIALISSCGKDDDGSTTVTGCTDSEATNYNPEATESDNNCVYARDQFIGMYEGSMKFKQLGGFLDQDSIDFSITPGITSINEVLIGVTIQSLPVFLSGTAGGNSITVDDEYDIPDGAAISSFLAGEPVKVLFSGSVSTTDGGQNIGGVLDVVFKTPENDEIADIVDEATLMGTKK